MNVRLLSWAIPLGILAIALAVSAFGTGSTDAQVVPTPTPTAAVVVPQAPRPSPPPTSDGCGQANMPRHVGGEPIRLSTGTMLLQVVGPVPGEYGSLPYLPDGPVGAEIGLQVCHVNSNSLIVISAVTGREISRTVGDPAGGAILDQIAAGATLRPAPNLPPSQPGAPVRPPTAGDGGLLPAEQQPDQR